MAVYKNRRWGKGGRAWIFISHSVISMWLVIHAINLMLIYLPFLLKTGHLCLYSLNCSHYSDVIMNAISSQITCVSIVYSTVCSGVDQRKKIKLRVTSLLISRTKGHYAENIYIWWRHHEKCIMPDIVIIWTTAAKWLRKFIFRNPVCLRGSGNRCLIWALCQTRLLSLCWVYWWL